MGIYGHNFEDFQIQNISTEEALEISIMCNEALVDYYENNEDIITEGANLEISKFFKEYKKEVKSLKKKYRSDYIHDKPEAINDLTKINSLITKTIKEIKNVDDNIVSTIIGDIYCILLDVVIVAAGLKLSGVLGKSATVLAKSSKVGSAVAFSTGLVTGSSSVNKFMNQVDSLIKNYDKFKNKEISAAEYFNLHKNAIIKTLEDSKKWNNALKVGIKEEIKNKEKRNKEDK